MCSPSAFVYTPKAGQNIWASPQILTEREHTITDSRDILRCHVHDYIYPCCQQRRRARPSAKRLEFTENPAGARLTKASSDDDDKTDNLQAVDMGLRRLTGREGEGAWQILMRGSDGKCRCAKGCGKAVAWCELAARDYSVAMRIRQWYGVRRTRSVDRQGLKAWDRLFMGNNH